MKTTSVFLPVMRFGGPKPHIDAKEENKREKTFDDLEPVVPSQNREKVITPKDVTPVSIQGRQLYEKIQEQKELEALDDLWED